jgi:hypothetical protein
MMSIEDEEGVKKVFNAYDCIAERYPKNQRHISAPDFRVSTPLNSFIFLCEVKSIESKENEFLLHNRVFNIFTTKIHEALGQFISVNCNHLVPNVITWVSKDFRIECNKFREFLQGHISVPKDGDDKIIVDLRKISQSRIKNEVMEIDLFILLQGNHPTFFFTGRDKNYVAKLMRVFHLDKTKMYSVKIG